MSSRLQEQRGQIRAECDACRARQRREIEDQVGLLLGCIGERIAEDQAAFGVGVVDLDRDARARRDDFARAIGIACDRILDGRNQQRQAHRQLGLHDETGQRDRMRGAAHVLLHPAHAVGGLDVETARVEADALADDDEVRAFLAPGQFRETRGAMARAADRMDRREIILQQRVADPFAVLRTAGLAEVAHRAQSSSGPMSSVGVVDQITRPVRGFDKRRDRSDHGCIDRELRGRAARFL